MTIGVLKEGDGENRVVLLPEHVASLVKKEFNVKVEKGAGLRAFTSDEAYTEAGAVVAERAEILKDADIASSTLEIIGSEDILKKSVKYLKDNGL